MPLVPTSAPHIPDLVRVTGWNTVGSYAHYSEARDAVDRLAGNGFPVDELEIVGSDLRTVERVTGRMTTQRAVVSGAAGGAWIGLFVGLLIGLFTTGPGWFGLVVGGLLLGTVWGAVLGLVAQRLAAGHHNFSSLSTIAATRYDVIALDGLASRAREALSAGPISGPAHRSA